MPVEPIYSVTADAANHCANELASQNAKAALLGTDRVYEKHIAADIQERAMTTLLEQGEIDFVADFISGGGRPDLRMRQSDAYSLFWEHVEPLAKQALTDTNALLQDRIDLFFSYCNAANCSSDDIESLLTGHIESLLDSNDYKAVADIKAMLSELRAELLNGIRNEVSDLIGSDQALISAVDNIDGIIWQKIISSLESCDLTKVIELAKLDHADELVQKIGNFASHLQQRNLVQAGNVFRTIKDHSLKRLLCGVSVCTFCTDDTISTNQALQFLNPMLSRNYFTSQMASVIQYCARTEQGDNLLRGLLGQDKLDENCKAKIRQQLTPARPARPRPRPIQNPGSAALRGGMFSRVRRTRDSAAAVAESNDRPAKRQRGPGNSGPK